MAIRKQMLVSCKKVRGAMPPTNGTGVNVNLEIKPRIKHMAPTTIAIYVIVFIISHPLFSK